jgi:NhaA family Na+:H+ antiporter
MNEMNEEKTANAIVKTGIFHSPWEKSFAKILTPFEEFIHRQTTSGLLLMGMAVIALVLANGPLAETYQHWATGR